MARTRLSAAALLLLAAAAFPVPADARQEVPPADTAATADTVPADTAEADTAAGPPPSFPDRLEQGADLTAGRVISWDREDLLDSSALTLQDFLLDHAPGVLPLRAGFYFGPHQLADGPFGPGGVRIVVDGRELPPLASGQPDLSRISLASVERIRLVRRAGETVLRISSLDHEGEEAYSRISAGTGQPGADGIRGLFTNTAGEDFAVQAAIDHLNIGAGEMPGSRLDTWARVGWMPLDREAGVELMWRSESVDRTLGDREEDFDRSHLFLHARSRVADGLQAEVWAGRTRRDPRPDFFPAEDAPMDTMPPDTMPGDSIPSGPEEGPPAYEVEQLLGSLTYREEDAFLRLSLDARGGRGQPDLTGDLRGSVRLGRVVAEAGVQAASWSETSTTGWSAGLAYRPGWWEEATLRAEVSSGSRAAPRPGRAVGDSLVQSHDVVSVGTDVSLGPYELSATAARRTVEDQLPFGGFFDRALGPTTELRYDDVEVSLEGPLLPTSGFVGDHFTLRGFWRYATPRDGSLPYYVPNVLVRAGAMFRHTFFEENLEVRLVGRAVHRGAMNSASPGSAEPVALSPSTTYRSEVVIRIDTFRIWWRIDNLSGVQAFDFEGLNFPTGRNVFGIRWEFFN